MLLGLVVLLIGGAAVAAYVLTPVVHEGQPGETPELGRPGAYRLGTDTVRMTLPGRGRISAMSALTGREEKADRILAVRFWYPADPASRGPAARYDHDLQLPNKPAFHVSSQGVAIAGARPLAGDKYPLVVMSHGYGGWSTQFSNLAEHIASRGYIVAAIDHEDPPAEGIASFVLSFGNVMVDRTLDQRQVIAQSWPMCTRARHRISISSTWAASASSAIRWVDMAR